MKRKTLWLCLLYLPWVAVLSNSYLLLTRRPGLLWGLIPLFLLTNLLAGIPAAGVQNKRLKICYHGALLLTVFWASAALSVGYHILLGFATIPHSYRTFLFSGLLSVGVHFLLFWNGILCVYFASYQLGIRQRVVGALCGMIPLVNLVVLFGILHTVYGEVAFEAKKEREFRDKKHLARCGTRYPLLLVHGVFFRDTKYFNYWGRIPSHLQANGATVYYGNHHSAASVAYSAGELAQRIREIVDATGCEKVNIIAHSKGGLDCRYALAHLGVAPMVASLTTVNTPHRGCSYADHLLIKVPEKVKNKIAHTYNKTLKRLGEDNPDFLAAISHLTAGYCVPFDQNTPAPQGVYCQSVGSLLGGSATGPIPLGLSRHYVKRFEGQNDGLVSDRSFKWGERYTLLLPQKGEGISHGDMIDLSRRNLAGFDVRDFYEQLVFELKERGL